VRFNHKLQTHTHEYVLTSCLIIWKLTLSISIDFHIKAREKLYTACKHTVDQLHGFGTGTYNHLTLNVTSKKISINNISLDSIITEVKNRLKS